MLRAQGLFGDLQGPPVQGQGLIIGAHGFIQQGQVVEASSGIGVLRPQGLFSDLEGQLGQGQGLIISAHGPV